jgi:hypothetical protein
MNSSFTTGAYLRNAKRAVHMERSGNGGSRLPSDGRSRLSSQGDQGSHHREIRASITGRSGLPSQGDRGDQEKKDLSISLISL